MEAAVAVGTSKERPIEIDEEDESSDENSVIILDSDTEKEDGNGEDDENNGDDEDDEVDDEEDSEDSEDVSDEEDEDSDSSIDTDSVNSVWSDVGEAAGDEITTEAAEAKIIKKFERAMISIADNEPEKGRKILESLLEDPIIASFTQEFPDYECLEEPPRLAKMLQIFIATHKNLAKLCEKTLENLEKVEGIDESQLQNEEIQHLCQVLGYEPNNSEIWMDVALKSVEFGDLNFAKYAFRRCENLKESMESHATLLYLTCDYTQSLQVLKLFQEQNGVLNDKMKYLKSKIRDTNQYYKRLCDRIFEEDEIYATIDVVEKRKILAFDERIEELRKKLEGKREARAKKFKEDKKEVYETIQIDIKAHQDLQNVCTLFCDLFDRIHTWSHCRHQPIEITEWESRKDYLQVLETVEKLVDIVECVEELTEKTEENEEIQKKKKGKRQKREEKKEYLANWKKRLFIEKSDEVIVLDSEANTTADEDDDVDQESDKKSGGMPENELAQEFHLEYSELVSIMAGETKRERTPPPTRSSEFICCDTLLHLLEIQFSGGSHTILELLEHTLLLISDHTPTHGALPECMVEVTREMYNRLAMYEQIQLRKFLKLNILSMELDTRKALQTMVLRYISPFFKEPKEDENDPDEIVENKEENRLFVLRFMWKYAQTGMTDEIKLEYLHTLRSLLQSDESIVTSSGSFATWDVEIFIEELEKKKRIDSVKHLWKSKNYENLVEILQNDIDFSMISIEEAIELISYWIQSLEKLKSSGDLLLLIARAMHFYLFVVENSTVKAEKIERNLELLLYKVQRLTGRELKVSRRRLPTLSTIGYFICLMFKKYENFEKDWKNWKILYEIVKIQRGGAKEYIEKLDRLDDMTVMPLLELDLLVKAHEVLGEHECCAQRNYEFLLFIVDRFREIIDDVPILEMCYLKDNGFLWNNMNLELSQILFCLFGKFSRKVRALENHENGGKCPATREIAKKILSVILVQPLPLHDEKEKLGHDVIELINSKFSFLLEVSEEKKEKLKEFKQMMIQCETMEDINKSVEKCRDDSDDYIQSLVWYSMAFHSYKDKKILESQADSAKYAELYLLSEESLFDERLRSSIWGILGHANVHDLFQLELDEIHDQWKWRTMPYRLAVEAQDKEPVPHFDFAAILYQLASSLVRFQRILPSTDPRRQNTTDIANLRLESRQQFDRCLELTKLGEDGSQPEHQWLCYFFIGKLEAKNATWDILKIVEFFYEAACGCELAGFYYPQKVQTKKQQNFEPLEVHYQAFSAVYKYLLNNRIPDLETLRKLKTWLKLLTDGHKVGNPSSSLFKVNMDVYTIVDELVMDTVFKEKEIEKDTIPSQMDSDLCTELVSDIKDLCVRAFTLVTERFPHLKSHYRLAQLHFEKGDIDSASDQIFKNAFKRKKRDDGMFDNCVEISNSDLNRNGSFSFHIERCCKLGAQIVLKTMDLHSVVSMLVTMISLVGKDREDTLEKPAYKPVVNLYVSAMEQIVMSRDNTSTRSTPSPGPGDAPPAKKPHYLTAKSLRTDLWKLWQAVSKSSKQNEELIKFIKTRAESLIVHSFRSVEELRKRFQPSMFDQQMKKKMMKRKLDGMESMHPLLKNLAEQAGGAKGLSDLAMRLAAAQNTNKANSITEIARQLVQSVQTPAGTNALKQLAAKLAMGQSGNVTAQAKPPATATPSTSSTTSSAPKPAAPAAATTRPNYSPISSDEDVQCLDPPPAKKPAPAPPPPSDDACPPVLQRMVPMVPSIYGGHKAAIPGQSQPSKVPPAPPVQQPPKDVVVPVIPKQIKPQLLTPPKPVVQAKPVQAKPVQAKPAQKAADIQGQITAFLAVNGGPERVVQFILENANSTDPEKQAMAVQAYHLMAQQATPPKQPAPVAVVTPPKSNIMAQVMAAFQQAQAMQARQGEQAAAALKKAFEDARQAQAVKQAQATREIQEAAKKARLLKMAKDAKEKAEREAKLAHVRELARREQEEKAAKAKAALEAAAAKAAKEKAARQAEVQASAAKALQKLQAAQFVKVAQEAQLAQNTQSLAQQQALGQQLVTAWNLMTGGALMPSTSSAPNLSAMLPKAVAPKPAAPKQDQAASKAVKTTLGAQIAATSASNPIIISPQLVVGRPWNPKLGRPPTSSASRPPPQPIRQSTSTSALTSQPITRPTPPPPAPARPVNTQQAPPTRPVTVVQARAVNARPTPPIRPVAARPPTSTITAEQIQALDPSMIRFLNTIPDPVQRQRVLESLVKGDNQ